MGGLTDTIRSARRGRAGGLRQLLALLVGLVVGAAAVWVLATSWVESRLAAAVNARVTYEMRPGARTKVGYPVAGPFDVRRGYAALPDMLAHLERHGFDVVAQAHQSGWLRRLLRAGVAPPYDAVDDAGLVVRDVQGATIHDARPARRFFQAFDDVPPLVVSTLTFMENRELLAPHHPRSNPAVEWDRLVRATGLFVADRLGLPVTVQGGSTLATQIEKFRHSPGGRTQSATDKLRQIAGASLRAYRHGPDTRPYRREVVVRYLNTMPLAAAPGFGAVEGLGEGLYAWFGLELTDVGRALRTKDPATAAAAFKHVLALLSALPAPSRYLGTERAALERRLGGFLALLEQAGVVDAGFARAVEAAPLRFAPGAPERPPSAERRAATAVRTQLLRQLGVSDFYALDRLHLELDTSLDLSLQQAAVRLFTALRDPAFVRANGLTDPRLLGGQDPASVQYSVLLMERTATGNVVRVQADSLGGSFDVNSSGKIELGSTAKLRTLAHYLQLVAALHTAFRQGGVEAAMGPITGAIDPITQWAVDAWARDAEVSLETFLERALDRRYSASPGEAFFTGGGRHRFRNFDSDDDGRVLSVREGFTHSTNLVFVRLMRDLVRYHRSRLPYDAEAVLAEVEHPVRQTMLEAIAASEAEGALWRAYRRFAERDVDAILTGLLGALPRTPRRLAILYYAWDLDAGGVDLPSWLARSGEAVAAPAADALRRAYGNPDLTIADFGYLLRRHPLDVWCAGVLVRTPDATWDTIREQSAGAVSVASEWLFRTRNRRAQDLRLRVRIEEEAFARMTPAWRSLRYPFSRLVASYATALGSSGDRPRALAELMGIIIGDGVYRPPAMVQRLRFAARTPYEVVLEPRPTAGEVVLPPEVARALQRALGLVVRAGTGRRLAGAFRRADGTPAEVGGKTGTGDNRFAQRAGSTAMGRTATIVFHVDGRYFGVLTALVPGAAAARYRYTSALPQAVVTLLAPELSRVLAPASA